MNANAAADGVLVTVAKRFIRCRNRGNSWKHGGLFVRLRMSQKRRSGCFPANRCRLGGFVRLNRPLNVIRLAALLLGIAVCLPTPLDAQTKTARKPPAKSSAAKPKVTPKPAYSASAAKAR